MTDHAKTSLRIAIPVTLVVAVLFASGLLVDRRQVDYTPVASAVTVGLALLAAVGGAAAVWCGAFRARDHRAAEARAAREELARRGPLKRKRRGRFAVASPDVHRHKHMPWYHGGLRD